MAGLQTEPGADRTASAREESFGLAARALAHDFNNLLTSILGHASYLRIAAPGEIDQAAAAIELAVGRATGLAEQLHKLGTHLIDGSGAAQPASNFQPVDLHAIVLEVVAMLRTRNRCPVEFTLALKAANPIIPGDAGQLNQMVMNLAINACEAMSAEGGQLGIRTSDVKNGVQLEVADSGPGIPPEARSKIFEPSYSTKPRGGLGLVNVMQIAKAHRATIEVADNLPRGTVFRVTVLTGLAAVSQNGVPA